MAPRYCYIVLETQYDENGYIPSVVLEGEAGHRPMTGDPAKLQVPWYWGKTFAEAEAACAAANAQRGLLPTEIEEIVLSSMRRPPLKIFKVTLTAWVGEDDERGYVEDLRSLFENHDARLWGGRDRVESTEMSEDDPDAASIRLFLEEGIEL